MVGSFNGNSKTKNRSNKKWGIFLIKFNEFYLVLIIGKMVEEVPINVLRNSLYIGR